MPPEPTKAKLKRRSSRKDLDELRFDGTHARELEQKRNRGEVSCAECRRLKIKCDKQIPCQSCQRRGCTALCPNGSLSTGQGTRFVLAATEHLHRRIAKLSGRVRQLEDALAHLQAKHTSEPHPLLHADLISSDERNAMGEEDMEMRDESGASDPPNSGGSSGPGGVGGPGEVIDAFGTLSISQHGVSRFFGATGGTESLLLSNLDTPYYDLQPTPQTSSSPSFTPPLEPRSTNTPDSHRTRSSRSPASTNSISISDLSLFSSAFPFTPVGQPADIQELIEAHHLPTLPAALAYSETYFDKVAWLFRGLTRVQVVEDMLPVVFKQRAPEQGEDYSGPHDLALLFMVFAIGALVGPQDDPPPPGSGAAKGTGGRGGKAGAPGGPAQGEHFYQIARAALSLQPVLEKPSIVTVQSLHLMSVYNAMSGSDMRSETSMEMTWSLITLAAHLSQTIGLHRDSERWGLTPKMVQRRRILFWDLFVADVWQSLNTGRPPTFSLPYVDCSFPQYEEHDDHTPEKKMDIEYELWQFKFSAEVVAEVTARTLTAEAPTYATIMELDRKVREFPLPESMSNPNGGEDGHYVSSFQRCILDHIRETVLLYIHRSFFAQAIIDRPENPLKSTYAPSFLASYRASSAILKTVIEHFNTWPGSSARFWTMWTFAFTAAVVFGTVVTRGPRSPLAKSAMRELEQACVLFSKASMYSVRAAKALPILKKLNEKAHYALQAAQSDPSGDNGLHWTVKQEDTEDELAIFAGHTRFVSGRKDAVATNANTPTTTTPAGATARSKAKKAKKSSPESSMDGAFEASTGMFQTTLVPIPLHPHQAPPLVSQNVPPSYRGVQQQGFEQQQQFGNPRTTGAVALKSQSYAHSGDGSASPDSANMDTSGPEGSGSGVQGSGAGGGRSWPPTTSSYANGGQHLLEHPYSYAPPESRPPVVLSMRHGQQQHQQHQSPYNWTPGAGGEAERGLPRISRAGGIGGSGMYAGYSHLHPNSSGESVDGGDARGGYGSSSSPSSSSAPYASLRLGMHQQVQHHHHHHPHQPQHYQPTAPPPPHHQQQQHHVPQYHSMYSAFAPEQSHSHHQQQQQHRGPPQPPSTTNDDLADLGIASRDSRLDEKWSMFMSDSGILEPGFRTG